MSFTISIPPFFAEIRREYLYDLQAHRGEFEHVVVFGATSIPPRAVMFTCMTDRGCQFARLPVSAFVHKQTAPDMPLTLLELWGAFSYHFVVVQFDYLKEMRCDCLLRDRKWYSGEYMMTFDWYGDQAAEDPGEGGFKTAHLVRLDNGCFALQPNNRMRWHEPSFITKPFPEKPDYRTNSHVWQCEMAGKWQTEDSDAFFYETKGESDDWDAVHY